MSIHDIGVNCDTRVNRFVPKCFFSSSTLLKNCPHAEQIEYVFELLQPLGIPRPTDEEPLWGYPLEDGFCGWRKVGSDELHCNLFPRRYCVSLLLAGANALWLAEQACANIEPQHVDFYSSEETYKKAEQVILTGRARTLCNRVGLLEHWQSAHNVQDPKTAIRQMEIVLESFRQATIGDLHLRKVDKLPPCFEDLRLPGLLDWPKIQEVANVTLSEIRLDLMFGGCQEQPKLR